MAPKNSIPSKNSIRCYGSSSSSSSVPSIPDSMRFHDEKARDDFFENFFEWGIHSECQVILSNFPDTTLPSAFSSRGWASSCEIPKRFPNVFIQEFYSNMNAIDTSMSRLTMVFYSTRIVVTLEFISKVLHFPRVDCPDYLSHHCLSSVSRDEMASLFYEKAMVWGETLNFSTTGFAKGLRILNMVMTFVLTTRFHYNTNTNSRAHFLLFLMEDLSIDFPSHMIESMIDCY